MTDTACVRRAPAMAAEDRRVAIVEATIAAIHEHGAMPTTRQIAQAARVAEGTIFRVFDTKEQLRAAVLQHTFDPAPFLSQLEHIDAGKPLREVLLAIVRALQQRLGATFTLMQALGLSAPPADAVHASGRHLHTDTAAALHRLIVGHQSELAVPANELAHIVRLLAFAGSHRDIAHGRTLTAEQTVDILLYGALRRTDGEANSATAPGKEN